MKTKFTKQQQIAILQIKEKANYILGGWENSLLDGLRLENEILSHEELLDDIYEKLMYDCNKEIKFLGTEWIKKVIDAILKKEGY